MKFSVLNKFKYECETKQKPNKQAKNFNKNNNKIDDKDYYHNYGKVNGHLI